MASKQAFVIFFRSQSSELYAVEGNRHFMTRRFDRDGDKKAHTQTLAAIYPDAEIFIFRILPTWCFFSVLTRQVLLLARISALMAV